MIMVSVATLLFDFFLKIIFEIHVQIWSAWVSVRFYKTGSLWKNEV